MKIRAGSILIIVIFLIATGVCRAQNKPEKEPPKKLEPIGVGELVQSLDFEDINGKKGSTEDYQDWIIVYSLADRKSHKTLIAWIDDVGPRVAKAHPEVKIAYINFADVTIVPTPLRHLIGSILRLINQRSSDQMKEDYASQGVFIDSDKLRFVMVPDWTGKYLQAFRLPNAKNYRSYVTVEGKILAMFDAQTQNIKETFINFFDQLIASRQSVRSAIEPLPESKTPAPAENPQKPGSTPAK
ncbi:MAG: hypothetical protein NT009_11440 [Proteobacteria bacterium]|nr:hypothetical protein [Pseudomonadota bacterium]